MEEGMKAGGSIRFDRQVYVSGSSDDVGSPLVEPIVLRIRNSTDFDVTRVIWYRAEVWKPAQLRQSLEEVTDFVLLVDDNMCTGLREARPDQGEGDPRLGQELLVVLQRRDDRVAAGLERTRIWLAMAASLELIALRRIAGKKEWNFEGEQREGRLHWFYELDQLVMRGQLVNGRFIGEDERLLGQNVKRFAGHEAPVCKPCGAPQTTP